MYFRGGGGGGTGSKRQRERRKEVAGPYRDQSSNPEIRAQATKHEHRKVAPPPRTPLVVFRGETEETGPDLAGALRTIATAVPVTPAQMLLSDNPVTEATRDYLGDSAENLLDVSGRNLDEALRGSPRGLARLPDEKELRAAADLAALTPIGAGAKAGTALKGAARALSASKQAATLATKQPVRSAAKAVAEKAEPAAVRALRSGAARRAGKAVERVPKPVRTAGKVAGQAATLPAKRPFTAPIAAQAPAAAMSGDPSDLGKAFTGEGTLAAISASIGEAGKDALPGVAGNAFDDLVNLPAVVLPSAYLPAAGAVEAAQGDSSRLKKLWEDYLETGALPAALRGDAEAALAAVEEHPLYSALEASGGAAVVGRGAGAVARGATSGRVGGTARPSLEIRGMEKVGNVRSMAGRFGSGSGASRYSPDLIRQGAQRLADRRREQKQGGQYATSAEASRVLGRVFPDRFAYEHEQVRRVNRHEGLKAMQDLQPKSSRFKADKASAGVVALAAQRIIRSPETFADDLQAYRAQLEQAHLSGQLTRAEKSANRALVGQIDRALKSANPEEVVQAANAFIEHHGKLVDDLVERGLLDRDQAEKAALIPFARVHMDANYKDGMGVVDRDGNPLSLDQIKAAMERQGIEPPGFLTHRPRTNTAMGAYYRALFPERQMLPKQARTGEAVAKGTFDTSYRALIEQVVRSRSIVDATVGFDEMLKRVGIAAPKGVDSMNAAYDVLRNPDRYGFEAPPGVVLRPIRTAPFLALKRELTAASDHQALLDPENAPLLENVAAKTLEEAAREGAGPIAFVPEEFFKRMQEHFRPTSSYGKVAQFANTAFKGAVLPFSPSFYIGNAADSWMKFALTGAGPFDVALGKRIAKGIPDGARESIIPGAGYGSFKRVHPYRDGRQFEGTPLGQLGRGLHALRETPGPKQAVSAFTAVRDFLLEANSRMFERLPQYGVVGKEARRELQATSGHWHHALTISDDAFKDLVKGLRGTDKQVQYARAVEEVFGNWGKNGPFARHVLTNLVPFWMWGRAATRFVLLTLPAHHPIKTGIVAAAAEMTEGERKRFGLDKFADEPLPGFLQGSLPIGGGVGRNIPKYTAFGIFGDLPEFAGRLFFAQGTGPLNALQGLDWKGDKLAKEDGTPVDEQERAMAATLATFEQFIPGISLIQGLTSGEPGKFSPLATYEGDKLRFFRELSKMQQITVPASGSSSGSSGVDYGNVFSGGSGSGVDYGAVFGGER